jgi:uncharacterized phage protein (TIGR01671 family)
MNNNRTFKFKVWDTKNKKFVSCINDVTRLTCDGIVPIPITSDRYIIQQYTGVNDSTGKEIYEGDICLYQPSYVESKGGQLGPDVSSITFEFGCFYFDNLTINEFIENETDASQNDGPIANIKIIGNVFENLELLGKN